jgi:hypothetical protein
MDHREYLMPTVDSDDTKSFFVGQATIDVLNIFGGLPGKKRLLKGVAYFENSTENHLYLSEHYPNLEYTKRAQKYKIQRTIHENRTSTSGSDCFEIPFKLPPLKHQLEALKKSKGREFFGYFMEQGTGKTKTLLDDAANLFLNGGEKGKIDTLVIIAPNGVHRQWVTQQIPEHLSDAVPRLSAYTVAEPTPKEATALKKAIDFKDGLRIIAVHIDTLSREPGQKFLSELLNSGKILLVVDESSRIKDPNSKRTKFILSQAHKAKYRRILTGTPISQGVEDLYSQFQFLSPSILKTSSFYAFRNTFCTLGGYQNKKITGYKNEDLLIRLIDANTFRVLKEDCLDLPPKIIMKREVPLTIEQRTVYNSLKKDFIAELDEGVLTSAMAITRLIRLQQVVGGVIWRREQKEKDVVVVKELKQELRNNRVSTVLDILSEMAPGRKCIIWVKFEGEFHLLTRALTEAGIGWVDYVGTTPTEARQKNIDRFFKDPSIKVFLASAKAAGIGLNITCASEVIWYSRDFSLEVELQANDRCYRIGQTLPVTYHYLYSPGTVDVLIDKALSNKQNISDSLIDIRGDFDV